MDNRIFQVLKHYFGYDSFKEGQEQIIDSILSRKDVVGVMPTGAGKSICYQLPALMLPGVTLVISPLIALMKDQVDSLNTLNIPGTYINSALDYREVANRIRLASQSKYKLLYITPERLESEPFRDMLKDISVSFIAVDEAHCVSHWGHDFRPSYLSIAALINQLPTRPVVGAFTATATNEVKKDMVQLLSLRSPSIFTTGFDRPNLYFSVEKPVNKLGFTIDYLENHKDHCGIIYAATRKEVDKLYAALETQGYSVGKYHGGLSDLERNENQETFIYDKVKIMVATNAFGMGIDKSNIQFVLHYNMPKNMESYYQEAGRAGRDGSPAECILLYSAGDIHIQRFLIEQSPSLIETSNEYKKLQNMIDYCNTPHCLRKYILTYFGENSVQQNCNNCGNCSSDAELTDITVETQKILSCVKRMGENYGSALTAAVLKGSAARRVLELGFNQLSTYGIMREYPTQEISNLISFLVAEGYLSTTQDMYPVLNVQHKALPVLKGMEKVMIRTLKPKRHVQTQTQKQEPEDLVLFDLLRALRRKIADEEQIPPYIIFNDRTLREMCKYFPTDNESILSITGVGQSKLEKYGALFMEIIQKYVDENHITIPTCARTESPKKPAVPFKTASHLITYDMYREGKTLKEIAAERNVTLVTVQDHMVRCYQEQLEVRWDEFVPVEHEDLILKAIKEQGTERLRPIKEALPSEIDYFTIRAVMCKHNLC